MRVWCLSVILILLVAGVGSLAFAQTQANSDPAALQKKVQQLEDLVKNLQQKVNEMGSAPAKQAPQQPPSSAQAKPEAAASNDAAKSNDPAAVVTFGRNGFTIASPDKVYRLKLGGQFQLDGKFFYGNNAYYNTSPNKLIDSFQIRKARPVMEGNLGQYIEFRIMSDFGCGKAQLVDAYVDFKPSSYAVLRAGKFKTPLGLNLLQGDSDLTFIERSLASDLIPNRSEGAMLSGSVKGRFTYQAAIMNGAPVGQSVDNATNRGKDIITRVFLTPFTTSKVFQGLGFGAAATTGRQEGAVLPTLNTSGGQIAFFTYGSGSGATAVTPVAAGHRLNYTPQMYYYYGPVGFMGEYVQSNQRVSATVSGNAVARDITNQAWHMEGSWVITGEKKSYKSVTPRKGWEGGKEGFGPGAWELVLRYSALRVDPTAFAVRFADPAKSAQVARNWAIGVNWYLNYFVKLAFDYEQTRFEGGAAAPTGSGLPFGNRPTEKVFMQRLQLVF